ncbi:MAG: hypothetical protein UU77_C0009G0001 [candidate division WWE3 bacterium GW2011_GWC1_41_7]|uniref:Uncharacterized protein n=2 Tax=Katanobacteria TaxID=422282 RepID=A0A0G0X7I7_UNCKA|nr:MAG: hypothetical protein UU77_C0009G0001 [candidate division WWE3 bacterium GW2011_GWC1_41_7]
MKIRTIVLINLRLGSHLVNGEVDYAVLHYLHSLLLRVLLSKDISFEYIFQRLDVIKLYKKGKARTGCI